jgi:hypothetical protein
VRLTQAARRGPFVGTTIAWPPAAAQSTHRRHFTFEDGTPMKIGIKQSVLSTAVFAGILLALVSFDDRVRDRFTELLYGSAGAGFGSRASGLAGALVDAARYQSIENAPLVVFAAVSAVLVLFMWRT